MGKRSLLAKIYRKLHKMVNKSNKVKRTSEDIQVPDVKGSPSIYHAVIIIFLEFFAWGLLTTPMMNVLKETFGDETFLMNGITQGIKGILSFISAPLLGALSDVWGRKPFLLLSVFFTCAPIPLMIISPWSFFTLISLSGAFAVTFSIIFAYVADITDETNRSSAYGLVSATFAASLVTSPAIGTYLESIYNLGTVVTIATIIFLTDFFFILLFVPESLNMDKQHDEEGGQQTSSSNGRRRSTTNTAAVLPLTKTDFYGLFRNLGQESTLLMFCITVFLSYLPEAGQYSCIFVYLRHVIGFSDELVALYIAVVGILSILAQTAILTVLYQAIGNKATILLGLLFQIGQLLCYSFGREHWTMWMAGVLAALSSINYPALSSLASAIVSDDKQGVVQGMITGVRGLCNGLGPALFGVTFHIFNVELDPTTNVIQGSGPTSDTSAVISSQLNGNVTILPSPDQSILPGPPFLFGTLSAIMALMTAIFLPNHLQSHSYSPVAAQESDFVMKSSSLMDNTTSSSSSSRQTTRLSIVQHTSRGGRDNNYESRISNYDDSSGGATSGSDAEPPPPTLPLSRGHQDKYL